ncbi:transglutaminase-like cysteine peptidase [Spongorhabdus nitratireducens]
MDFSSLRRFLILFCISALALAGRYFLVNQGLVDQVTVQYGERAATRLLGWDDFMRQQSSQQQDDMAYLESVNNYFNDMRFVSDRQLWGTEDYWATPVEFLSRGAGDCEDFSIAKYFTLRQLGIADERLRITYVKALNLNQAHMVLTYFPEGSSVPLVLDNLIGDIRPATERSDLAPVYNFNGDGLWLAKQRGHGKRVGEANRLSLWMALRERLNKDLGSE